jgi:hypothetical protein
MMVGPHCGPIFFYGIILGPNIFLGKRIGFFPYRCYFVMDSARQGFRYPEVEPKETKQDERIELIYAC